MNGDESEPGTFKDRQIFESNPHLLIEGALIAAYAMGVTTSISTSAASTTSGSGMVQKAVDDAYAQGYIGQNILGSGFSTDLYLHRGAGAYICGEESSLMNSLEGERGLSAREAAVPGAVRSLGLPDHDQQRRDDRQRPGDSPHGGGGLRARSVPRSIPDRSWWA